MIDFAKAIAGAKFTLIAETGWNDNYDPEMMGGKYALVAETEDHVIFLGDNGYQIQDPVTLDVFFFDFNGNEI